MGESGGGAAESTGADRASSLLLLHHLPALPRSSQQVDHQGSRHRQVRYSSLVQRQGRRQALQRQPPRRYRSLPLLPLSRSSLILSLSSPSLSFSTFARTPHRERSRRRASTTRARTSTRCSRKARSTTSQRPASTLPRSSSPTCPPSTRSCLRRTPMCSW